MDLLIRGGMLFDGSGGPGVQRDVAIRDGRIVAIGADAAQAVAGDVLDAGGLAVAPGFVDLHSHADHTLPTFPRATNSLSQGVTTEVVGLCGFSVAPVAANPSRAEQLRELASGIGPYLEWNWHTFDDYLNQFQAAGPAVNVAPLVGHHALRILAMGMEDRPPTPAELALMRGALADALNHGAWGMSTGLVYVPGSFAVLDELLELGQELARVDGLYVSHLRDESDGLVGAVEEALTIGSRLGIRTQISHLKITARRNAGHIGSAIARLEDARQHGVRRACRRVPVCGGQHVSPPGAAAVGEGGRPGRRWSSACGSRSSASGFGTTSNRTAAAGPITSRRPAAGTTFWLPASRTRRAATPRGAACPTWLASWASIRSSTRWTC